MKIDPELASEADIILTELITFSEDREFKKSHYTDLMIRLSGSKHFEFEEHEIEFAKSLVEYDAKLKGDQTIYEDEDDEEESLDEDEYTPYTEEVIPRLLLT